jgi:ribonuclease HI
MVTERSFEPLTIADLARLADFAQLDRADRFRRRPQWAPYRDRILLVALCQGAASHFVDGRNGVKDFDVYTFYAEDPEIGQFPPRWRLTADFGESKFGQHPEDVGYRGRRIDLIGRSLPAAPSAEPIAAVRGYLARAKTETAKQLAKKALVAIDPPHLRGVVVWPVTVVWTDGSCNAKGIRGLGGWAALIEQAGTLREIYDGAHGTTHNRMELTAICEALEALTGAIEVRTDSTYVEKCFNQNWHERWLRDGSWKGSSGSVKNRDLWERLFGLVWDERRHVTFKWIKGHAGDPNNQRVDQLARAAALSIHRS